jgi:hypothetical protein
MHKWRIIQNGLAWIIALEMIVALTCAVYYALILGAGTDSFIRFGDSGYAARLGALMTFVGLSVLFLFREPISTWLIQWASVMQRYKEIEDEEDEDDE